MTIGLEDIEAAFIDAWSLQFFVDQAPKEPLTSFGATARQVARASVGAQDLENALVALFAQPGVPSLDALEATESPFVQAVALFVKARQRQVPLADAFVQACSHIRRSPGGCDYNASDPKPAPVRTSPASAENLTGWQTFRAPS